MDQKSDESIHTLFVETPIDWIQVEYNHSAVLSLHFISEIQVANPLLESDAFGKEITSQLNAYFNGDLVSFDLPLQQEGTLFQQKVWKELTTIPYGKQVSYSEFASQLGDEALTRAVATANARNKILILVPCHRVIGKDGTLTGYSGGLDRKRWLLQFENKKFPTQGLLF